MKDSLPSIMEKKPWISSEEGQDLQDKIEEMRTWLDEKIEAQALAGLAADPVLTADQVSQRAEKVGKLFKKITDKKKPKEKKPKKEEKEEKEENQDEQQKEEDL